MQKQSKSEEIENILSRGVEELIDRESLEKKLLSGKKLRIKLGIDPTSPNIHLGRSIPLLKLRDFQELGHTVVFIIGDSTGIIGDTSDKESERPMLTKEIVQKNLQTYIEQAGKVIDISKAEIHHNSEWLDGLTYQEIGRQAGVFSLNSFIMRENIRRRIDDGKRVSLRELLYPLMQGYDSVKVNADVEIGGTDQRFNLLAGRDLQREYGQEPQDIMTNPILEGLDGRKMSSSWGNTVNLLDMPNDMYGKIMSLRDEFIIRYFTLATRVPLKSIDEYVAELKAGANPRDMKMNLAYEIVRMYHSENDAVIAKNNFVSTFAKKEVPDDIQTFCAKTSDLLSVLIDSKLITSKSDARRVLSQNGVKVNGKIVTDPQVILKKGDILQKGKLNFLKIE